MVWQVVLLQFPFRYKPMCGDAPGLTSTANVLFSQSHRAKTETILLDREVPKLFRSNIRLARDPTYLHIGYQLPSLQGELCCSVWSDKSR